MLNKCISSSSKNRSIFTNFQYRALASRVTSLTSLNTRTRYNNIILIGSGIILASSAYACINNQYKAESYDAYDEHGDVYTMDHVSTHNSMESSWIVIDNIVYDITSLLDNHPGGKGILLSFAGKDVSREFYTLQHSDIASIMKNGLAIGYIKKPINSNKKRIVILGGGICGVSASYFLSKQLINANCTCDYDITVLENQSYIGGTALKSSAIMWLGPLLETNTSDIDNNDNKMVSLTQWLGEEAYTYFQHMQRNWEDIEFFDKSTVGLIETDDQLEAAQSIFGINGKIKGAQVITDPFHMLEIEPLIDPKQLKGIVYHPRGATVDPYLVCDAFVKRAKDNGVTFNLNHNVISLRYSHINNEYMIQCSNGKIINADVLVICTGYKAYEHSKWLGYNVPVKPMHGQMFALSVGERFKLSNNIYGLEGVTYWRKSRMEGNKTYQYTRESIKPYKRVTSHLYGVQLSNGVVKFGGDRIQADMNSVVLEDGIKDNYETVTRLFPQLKNEPIIGTWGGTMPFTPDQKIICGELNPSLYVLTGSGFMRGLASGKLLAQSIIKRHYEVLKKDDNDIVDQYLKQCDPLRFEQNNS